MGSSYQAAYRISQHVLRSYRLASFLPHSGYTFESLLSGRIYILRDAKNFVTGANRQDEVLLFAFIIASLRFFGIDVCVCAESRYDKVVAAFAFVCARGFGRELRSEILVVSKHQTMRTWKKQEKKERDKEENERLWDLAFAAGPSPCHRPLRRQNLRQLRPSARKRAQHPHPLVWSSTPRGRHA